VTPWWCGNGINIISAGILGTTAFNQACFPTIQPPVPEVPPSTPQQMTGAADWTPDMAIQATSVLQNQQNSGFFQNFGTGSTVPVGPAGGDGGQPSTSLCSMIFGTNVAGQIGQTLCPLVMIVGGVAVIALVGLVLAKR
jgi:hypothetical protein